MSNLECDTAWVTWNVICLALARMKKACIQKNLRYDEIGLAPSNHRVSTNSSLGEKPPVRWILDKYAGPSLPSMVVSITDCLVWPLNQSLQSQACCRSSISLLLVTLSVGALEQRRASDCFYTSIPNSIPQGYSDGRLNLREEKRDNC